MNDPKKYHVRVDVPASLAAKTKQTLVKTHARVLCAQCGALQSIRG